MATALVADAGRADLAGREDTSKGLCPADL